jgi:hypothetical protein
MLHPNTWEESQWYVRVTKMGGHDLLPGSVSAEFALPLESFANLSIGLCALLKILMKYIFINYITIVFI